MDADAASFSTAVPSLPDSRYCYIHVSPTPIPTLFFPSPTEFSKEVCDWKHCKLPTVPSEI